MSGNVIQPAAAGTAKIASLLMDQSMPPQTAAAAQEAAPAAQPEGGSFEERARKVKFMLDNGFITQEQYQEKIAQLMSEI